MKERMILDFRRFNHKLNAEFKISFVLVTRIQNHIKIKLMYIHFINLALNYLNSALKITQDLKQSIKV